ncbi:arylsulfatase [Pontibacter sp. G13]|uniref:sulfatase family protein n=1 Tax=Pontibacter sp. G13 TaxID=3074898 RepID=UPI00288A4711|nr:arylsulfatase [Pontibacter sp. G13]WNJ16576.1 arylsulfatase [Pontibacter sp. G13]
MKKYVLLLLVSLSCLTMEAQDRLPNVVVILADDIGSGDLSAYRRLHSSDSILLETPNLDMLAADGVMFTNGHSPAALCAPSRYAVMTGQHCYRSPEPWGVWSAYSASVIRDDQPTLGRVMQSAGYQTAFMGKWHLGGRYYQEGDTTQFFELKNTTGQKPDLFRMVDDGPLSKGFDESFTFPAGIQAAPYAIYENGNWMPIEDNSSIVPINKAYARAKNFPLVKKAGLGDSNWDPHIMGPLLAREAESYIHLHAQDEKPFFLYYCALAVHVPHTPCDTLDGVAVKGTTPSGHMDMIKELDVQIGLMIKALKKQGIYEETVFIFTSDNGGLQRQETIAAGHRSSDIYRGSKNLIYEGGHRVPFIVSWPGKISGGQSDEPVLGLDVMATLADITGVELSSPVEIDSRSLMPILEGARKAEGHELLMVQGGTRKTAAITEGKWKLIIQIDRKDKTWNTRKPIALFNLEDNLQEQESGNMIDDPRQRKRVQAMFQAYNEQRDGPTE